MSAMGFNDSWKSWHSNRHFLLVVLLYALAAVIASAHWHISVDIQIYSDAFLLFGFGVTVILFAIISVRVMLERPPRLYPAIRDRLLIHKLPERLIIGLPVMLVLPIFFSLFTSMKDGISRIVPFYADKYLIELDRGIHSGIDAWRILDKFVGIGFFIFSLNFLYNLWFIVMLTILFCVTFTIENERTRSQYLVAFVLIWIILGNVAAVLFSSVGPAFVMSFYNDSTFLPLMNSLQAINKVYPVWALDAQRLLLANAGLHGPRLGSGISAFPSLHVAVATLNAIYLWRFGALLRWLGVAFLIAIQLGSVHLGWHYAVDGYASMLATPVIWIFAGWLSGLRRLPATANAAG
ncbi:hypothetical protein FJ567_17440 [Mesorhizobium sp. B2-4-16]|nr:phosphatase PAP2 family protein [Mesorhizobium sp. B2-4-3]TPK99059.1 hypothetical protein FJ567_17440 [Mesorhizobium sp. B2-4-16]TPL59455.1 hypothetical protein FJ956_28460 [Mesorhizobium sp. B2-4-3]